MANESPIITQFTPEVLPTAAPKRVRNNILGTVLFFVLFNAALYFYLADYTPNLAYWLVQHKWRTLQTLEEPLDWVILGDSSGNQGLVTSEFEKQIAGRAYNFASAGAGVFRNDAWMLETYLERYGAPKGVVMIHIYDIWLRNGADWFNVRVPLPISQWDELTPPIELTLARRWNVTLLKYVPIYGQERTLSKFLQDIFWGRRNPLVPPYQLEEGGYWRDPRTSTVERLRASTAEHIKWTNGTPLIVSQVNLESLEYMISLAEENNFDLYYAISPLHDELYAHENFQGYFLQFQKLLDDYAAENEHFHNLGLISTFPAEQGLDSDHVLHEAALDYTEHLALKILETR